MKALRLLLSLVVRRRFNPVSDKPQGAHWNDNGEHIFSGTAE